MMENSKEILTNHIDEVTYDKDIPFIVGPLGEHCMHHFPHRHTFYEVLYVTEGTGNHIVDFGPYRIQPPLFYFISPGQVHFWDVPYPFRGHFIIFTEDFLVFPSSGLGSIEEISFFHTVGDSPLLLLNNDQAKKIDELLRLIENEFNVEEANRASVLRAYLHILIAQLQRMTQSNNNGKKSRQQSSLVRQFKHLVAENLLKGLSVQEYAEQMGMSASHLSNVLKSMTGYTPAQLIHNEMLLEAKRMLVHTDLTVSEVGYHLNFEDPSYFSRFFKREFGLNPKQFRMDIREKYQIFPE